MFLALTTTALLLIWMGNIQQQVREALDQDEEFDQNKEKGNAPTPSDTPNHNKKKVKAPTSADISNYLASHYQAHGCSVNHPAEQPSQTADRLSKNPSTPVLSQTHDVADTKDWAHVQQFPQPSKTEAFEGQMLLLFFGNAAQDCESENCIKAEELQKARFPEQYPDEYYPYRPGTELVVVMELSDVESESSTTDSS